MKHTRTKPRYSLTALDLSEALAYDYHPQGCTCRPGHAPCPYCQARDFYTEQYQRLATRAMEDLDYGII